LIKSNIIHLFGLVLYGFILIGLSALGYKIMASVTGFKPAGASEKQSLFMGIITLGLIIGFSLIISITSYESAPDIVMLTPDASIVGQGDGCGAKRKPVASGCGSKAQEPAPETPDKVPSQ
jgi:hypothetical protein